MKHTIQTLKKNLTIAEVEALEKELREGLDDLKSRKFDRKTVFFEELMIKEILGE